MAERLARDLRYGHPGPTVYDIQSRRWNFGRHALEHLQFEPLGPASAAIAPSIRIERPTLSSHRSLLEKTQTVGRRYPDTFPGLNYSRFESKISETITAQSATLDPNQGELLDVGFAFRMRTVTIRVAALPGGVAGELLRLVPMRAEWQGWDKDGSKYIESMEPYAKEAGWWRGVGQPIQQVCFAHAPHAQWTYLAVRTSSTVSVFLPLRRNVTVTQKVLSTGYGHLSASRFDPNYMFTLSAEQLGQSLPTDVSFNPWEQHQFAVMNRQAHWTIWEIKRVRGDPKSRGVNRIKGGQLPKQSGEEDGPGLTVEDGWGRVMWVLDLNTIVVCSRIAMGIYDVSSELLTMETAILDISQDFGWLLDVRRHPVFEDHLFVTTTSRIFWLRVTEADRTVINPTQKSRVQVLLSWTHFRSFEDISLRTTTFMDDNGKCDWLPCNYISDHLSHNRNHTSFAFADQHSHHGFQILRR